IVEASQKHGGLFSMQDFAEYSIELRPPVACDYRGRRILSAPPPSSGGTTICEILQIIAPYPLASWGYASVQATNYLIEAERHAFADRNTYLGDPAFVDNPVEALLSAGHAARIRQQIQPDEATPSSRVDGSLAEPEGQHTTHYS